MIFESSFLTKRFPRHLEACLIVDAEEEDEIPSKKGWISVFEGNEAKDAVFPSMKFHFQFFEFELLLQIFITLCNPIVSSRIFNIFCIIKIRKFFIFGKYLHNTLILKYYLLQSIKYIILSIARD